MSGSLLQLLLAKDATVVQCHSKAPHPGRAFQPAEPTVYVRPDIFIVELGGKLKVMLDKYCLPRVSISDYYARLLKESDEKETREYLQRRCSRPSGC